MRVELGIVLCVLSVYTVVEGMPMPTPAPGTDMSMGEIEDYFLKYNYMGDGLPDRDMADLYHTNKPMAMHYAAMMFQRRSGLRETGELDRDTLELMGEKRCGMPDIETMDDMMNTEMKISRYTAQGAKWPKHDLTYQIKQYTVQMNPALVDEEVRRAFKVWSDVTPLTFTVYDSRIHSELDIEIKFVQPFIDHGDGYPFDGESGVLAHAFFPQQGQISGDAHFDEAETWTIGVDHGVNIFQVAAHEFGHSLGLGHSTDRTALMAPFYPGYIRDFTLPQDDIDGIQYLYGEAIDKCTVPTFDAVTSIRHSDNSVRNYVFSGSDYYVMDSQGRINPDEPRRIQDKWPRLPVNIEAALYWPDSGVTFVFKDDKYYQISEHRVIGRPKDCVDLPTNMDGAFYLNGKSYFFKGREYYRYTEGEGVDAGYPKDTSDFDVPSSGIDSAFQGADGNIYFFKDDQYYEHNPRFGKLKPDGGEPKYIADKFADCSASGNIFKRFSSYNL